MSAKFETAVSAENKVAAEPLVPHATILALAIAALVGLVSGLLGLLVVKIVSVTALSTTLTSPHFIGLLVTGVFSGVVTALFLRRFSKRSRRNPYVH